MARQHPNSAPTGDEPASLALRFARCGRLRVVFHAADEKACEWLAVAARAQPEERANLERKLSRLQHALDASERDRDARLQVIHEMQANLDSHSESMSRVLAALERSEQECGARLRVIRELESREQAITSELEARKLLIESQERALAEQQRERDAWRRLLPGVRVRIPGATEAAARLRRWARRPPKP
jgi:septal ring factor EnvC (AmiA/AmiB activator)